ncbi:hypothetical protein [Zestomonas thermotolerans]|uniref:hypothetical protein n=1 Tax=Zestomonas thermotolerans TaxID=157784 RepID=UPI0023F17ABA|nr:hypothetical protein [Pseudomonas thermotolerans]
MKKATPQYQQSSPSQGQSITVLSLFTVEEIVGVLLPVALVILFWLCEVAA